MLLKSLLAGTSALSLFVTGPALAEVTLTHIGSIKSEAAGEGAAEIVDYDPASKRLFISNAAGSVDIVDITDPKAPKKITRIDIAPYGAGVNSVAISKGVVALAIEAKPKTDPGKIVFFSTNGEHRATVDICALPDMVTFSPDGRYAVAACEGEPNDAFDVDPEGAVAIIDLSKGVANLDKSALKIAGFAAWNDKGAPDGARIGKPGAPFSKDVEPEYIAVSPDSTTAYVTLQENNAIAIVDLASGTVKSVVGLGWKDHSKIPFDASDKDGGINIKTWPVWGMYMPDSITTFQVGGATYLAIANEGDSRDYKGWSEEARVADLTLDEKAFPNAKELQAPAALGRLKTTKTMGDTDGDGKYEKIFSYGGRSFSILDASGKMIFDSADQFERYIAEKEPKNFNSTSDKNGSFDDRSDDKGIEPEAITTGTINGTPYIFIGFERQGGIMVYSAADPKAPKFETYFTSRNFDGDVKKGTAGDLAPEGFKFISAENSPTGKPMLAAAHEVSGTTALYEINVK
jgi:ferredoxin